MRETLIDIIETKFFKCVRAFYFQAMKYALANLPIKDPLLINAGFFYFEI